MVEIIDPKEDESDDIEHLGHHTTVGGGKYRPRALVPMKVLTHLGVKDGDSLTWLMSRETKDNKTKNIVKLVKR